MIFMGTRFCMYCGRQLADGEACDCRQSAAAQQTKQNTQNNTHQTDTSHTKHKKKERTYRFHDHWEHAKHWAHAQTKGQNPFKSFFSLLGQFFIDPVYLAMNTGRPAIPALTVLSIFQGLILSIAVLLAAGFGNRGLIRIFTNLVGLHGISGWRSIGTMALCGVGGAIVYMAAVMLLSFVLYAVGKWILRRAVSFWETASAVIICGIPMIVIGLFGIIFTLFSAPVLGLLLLCGFFVEFVLLYEAMRSLWGISSTKTLYITGLGLFLFLCICYNIIRVFML